MADRRYSDKEIAAIFRAATELPPIAERAEVPRDEGLTLADLQAIGREVGISADAVAQAAQAIDVRPSAASRTFLGLPIGVARTVNLNRLLTDEEWERLVVQLREVFNARGRTRSEGSLRQWTNGNLQVLLEPTDTGHRLRFRTVHGAARASIGTMHRPEAQAMTGVSGFEKDLQVSIGPLPQRALGTGAATRVENLAQLHDQALPLFVREQAIQVDRPGHTDRESQERARGGAGPHVDGLGSLRDRIGRNADLATDRLEVREGQAFIAGDLGTLPDRRQLRRRAEDRGDLLVTVAAVGHDLRSPGRPDEANRNAPSLRPRFQAVTQPCHPAVRCDLYIS